MTAIDKLTLVNFRAFPGAEPVELHLKGKNLLIYGENGSGKTSIFTALTEMLRHPAPRKGMPATPWENIFAGAAAAPWSVTLDFLNKTKVVWNAAGVTGTGVQFRNEAALMSAALDYRSLLDTNYLHADGEVNLFDALVTRLLASCGVTSPGVAPFAVGTAQIQVGDFWSKLFGLRRDIGRSSTTVPANIITACTSFNQGINALLSSLTNEANTLLSVMGHPNLQIQPLICAGVTPKASHWKDERRFDGRMIPLKVIFQEHPKPLDRPQLFLNEARLSAIGLSLYFAARKVVVSQSNLTGPKVLVLDDVLIGLDQANRIPVLDVLQKQFDDWQIVLLTHDRAFYEIAKQRLDDGKWVRQEIYAGRVGDFEKPLLVDDEADLYRALAFLDRGEVKAAAVHVRSAFENVLKDSCLELGIKVRFNPDPRKVPASDLWGALKSHTCKLSMLRKICAANDPTRLIKWVREQKEVDVVPKELIQRIDHSVSWVLNPLSHSQTVDRYRREIEDAIFAVDDLANAVRRVMDSVKVNRLQQIQNLAEILSAVAINRKHK